MAKDKKENKPKENTFAKKKTNHQTGWHRRIRNPTTNMKMDSHKRFCHRCRTYNKGCPNPGGPKNCSL